MPPDPPSTLDLSGLLRHERQALAHIAAGRPLKRVLEELSFAVESTSVGMLASVLLLEADGLHLTHGAAPSLPAEYNAAVEHLPVGPFAGSCGAAAHTREAVYVADIATDPRWENYRHIALTFGLRACWSMPILASDGRVLGTFATYYREPRAPSQAERDTVAFVARTAALALQRHASDRAIRESEDHYRHTVELNPQVSWTATPDGQLDHVAERWRDWTGTTGSGASWVAAIHPDDIDRSLAAWARSVATGEAYDIEHRVRLRDGGYRWMHSRSYPRRDARGAIVKWYGNTEDVDQRHQVERSLREREAQLQRLNATLEEQVRVRTNELTALTRHLQTVQEDERTRIGLVLHDELGAVFTTAKMDAVRLKARLGTLTPEAQLRLDHLLATLDEGIDVKRRIIEDLRPPALTNLGMVEALNILMNDFRRRTGCRIDAEIEELQPAPSIQLTAYRLVQEALTNIERHAGATRVQVRLVTDAEGMALLTVSDDGRGFEVEATPTGSHGLTGLRYRVEAEGGRLQIQSGPTGTTIGARLPLPTLLDIDLDLPADLVRLVRDELPPHDHP